MFKDLTTSATINQELNFKVNDEKSQEFLATVAINIESSNPSFNELFGNTSLEDYVSYLEENKLLSILDELKEKGIIDSHNVFVRYSRQEKDWLSFEPNKERTVYYYPLKTEISALNDLSLSNEEDRAKVLQTITDLELVTDYHNLAKRMSVKEHLTLLSQDKISLPNIFYSDTDILFDTLGNYIKTPVYLEFNYWDFKDENNSKERMEKLLTVIKDSGCLVFDEKIDRIPYYNQRTEDNENELGYEEYELGLSVVLSDDFVEKLKSSIDESSISSYSPFNKKEFIKKELVKLLG